MPPRAQYTEQLVIMVTPHQKAAVLATAEEEDVSKANVSRRWLDVGLHADPGMTGPARMARAAQLEAELAAKAPRPAAAKR